MIMMFMKNFCLILIGSFRIDPNQSAVPFAFVSCEGIDGQEGFNFPQLVVPVVKNERKGRERENVFFFRIDDQEDFKFPL